MDVQAGQLTDTKTYIYIGIYSIAVSPFWVQVVVEGRFYFSQPDMLTTRVNKRLENVLEVCLIALNK